MKSQRPSNRSFLCKRAEILFNHFAGPSLRSKPGQISLVIGNREYAVLRKIAELTEFLLQACIEVRVSPCKIPLKNHSLLIVCQSQILQSNGKAMRQISCYHLCARIAIRRSQKQFLKCDLSANFLFLSEAFQFFLNRLHGGAGIADGTGSGRRGGRGFPASGRV